MKKLFASLLLGVSCSLGTVCAHAQSFPADAKIPEKWQIGVGGTIVHPDYTRYKTGGPTVYGNYSFLPNFGIEARGHYAFETHGVTEYSFAAGPRYNLPLKRIDPFLSGLIGYGHFNYSGTPVPTFLPNSFIITYAGGVDYHVSRHINVRGEIDYQRWVNFIPNGLTPIFYTGGISYRH